jgi:ATP-dependent Clp protease ATP-binding subunit ClpB
VASLKARTAELQAEIAKNKTTYDAITAEINAGLELDRSCVLSEFSRVSGISANKLGEDDIAVLRRLEHDLKSRVFGQDHVLTQVSNGIKVAKVGRRNRNKPLASYMFIGPSGVGKTEVAKVVAGSLLGDEKALLRFDMSEYMEKHAVARLIGAPPGYEGFEAGGILTNAMRRNRNRVILFDEIEKAHPDVFNVLLQVLDDGRLTDNVGRVVSFDESIIIMTSNIGQPYFLDAALPFEDAKALANVELEKTYRSEFLNRFNGRQNIICFNRLDLDSIERIVRREIGDLDAAYATNGIDAVIEDLDLKAFCRDHYDPKMGARGLPGYIQANLEPIIVNRILERPDCKGVFRIAYAGDRKAFEVTFQEAA